ncbi:MAG: ABC transporter ATP-binding protein [Clostridia bacterium]|nr:ABC transporter ATP-binding protein [Clostridia bacterium]
MLEIKNLCFSYGKENVIENLSLELPACGVFAIMGPSGCGKSTLLALIAGVLKHRSGEINLNTKKIAFSFQDARLLPWFTALENVNYVLGGKKSSLERAATELAELGLGDDINKYPSELSGGMQRRVSLARAFAAKSEILLLDEPFTGLDSETKERIMKKVKSIGKNTLVILITHDDAEALECADAIYNFYDLMYKNK